MRAAARTRADRSGPGVREWLEQLGWRVSALAALAGCGQVAATFTARGVCRRPSARIDWPVASGVTSRLANPAPQAAPPRAIPGTPVAGADSSTYQAS